MQNLYAKKIVVGLVLTMFIGCEQPKASEPQIAQKEDQFQNTIIWKGETIHLSKPIHPQKYFSSLLPEGDYSKLEFTLQASKDKYRHGESIYIKTFLNNKSSKPVTVDERGGSGYFLADNIIEVEYRAPPLPDLMEPTPEYLKAQKKERPWTPVSMTRFGHQRLETTKRGQFFQGSTSGTQFRLHPNASTELKSNQRMFNLLYDMTLPGEYRITYYRTSVIDGQKFDPPLKSNTITIEVTDKNFHYDLLKEPGDFGDSTKPRDIH